MLQPPTASPNCLPETNWIYYIISSPFPKNSRAVSKSSPLNLADTRVGKSLNKNKIVYVLGEGAPQEDNVRREPTLPSAAELGWLPQGRVCSQSSQSCCSPSTSCPLHCHPPAPVGHTGTAFAAGKKRTEQNRQPRMPEGWNGFTQSRFEFVDFEDIYIRLVFFLRNYLNLLQGWLPMRFNHKPWEFSYLRSNPSSDRTHS